MSGVDLALIIHKLNHESIAYSQHYLGITGDELQAVAQRLNLWRRGIMLGRKNRDFKQHEYISLEDMVRAVVEAPNNINLKKEDLCMHCWTGY